MRLLGTIIRRCRMAIKKLKDIIDMGLVHGTKIHVMKFAPLGDPVEIKVKNFELALRNSEAGMIDVEVQ
ncbi:MAG: FeoA family protein [Veillonella sp.]|nr:FeoA family protein [Veillonella sp.]